MVTNFRDTFSMISKATPRRIWNAAKVYGSFQMSRLSGKAIQRGLPISFSIEPTTACNLGCPECPSGLKAFTRPTGNLKEDTLKKVIDEMSKHSMYVTFYFQGEPYINSDFLKFVNYASRKNMYTMTSTNGHFLNEENAKKTVQSGLDRLIISIDGTTQETYEAYRVNGRLDKVIEGTMNLVEWKKKLKSHTPHVVFQYLVVKPNEHQVEEVRSLAKDLGVDTVKFKTAQLYDYKNGNPLMPENQKYSRYRKTKDNTYELKNRMDNHCWKLWNSCVFTWDGNVVPCCFDKDASHQFGNIKNESFQEIWRNDDYKKFRGQLVKSRKEIDICANCSEGTKVWEN